MVYPKDLFATAYLPAAHVNVGDDENLFANKLEHFDVDDDTYEIDNHFDDHMIGEYLS